MNRPFSRDEMMEMLSEDKPNPSKAGWGYFSKAPKSEILYLDETDMKWKLLKEIMGIGGAPLRATTFPKDAAGRKARPVASGVLDYFPDALVAIAEVSQKGNDQHNPGKPMFWDRSKSGDEADALMRHFLQRGLIDDDGVKHSAKLAWRALALLQKEIESEKT